MKYVANVERVLKPGIHSVGTIREGKVVSDEDLPLPDRIIIETDESGDACMMYRYTEAGTFRGDTSAFL